MLTAILCRRNTGKQIAKVNLPNLESFPEGIEWQGHLFVIQREIDAETMSYYSLPPKDNVHIVSDPLDVF